MASSSAQLSAGSPHGPRWLLSSTVSAFQAGNKVGGHMHAPSLPMTELSQGSTQQFRSHCHSQLQGKLGLVCSLLGGHIAPRTEYVFCYHQEGEMSNGLTSAVSVTAALCYCVLGTGWSQEKLCPTPTSCLCLLALLPWVSFFSSLSLCSCL